MRLLSKEKTISVYFGQYVPYHLWHFILNTLSNIEQDIAIDLYCDQWDYSDLAKIIESNYFNIRLHDIELNYHFHLRRFIFIFTSLKYIRKSISLFLNKTIVNDDYSIAIWEIACVSLPKNRIRPNIFELFKANYSVYVESIRSKCLLRLNLDLYILGHKVYASRVLWLNLKLNNKKILMWCGLNFLMHSNLCEERLPFLIPRNKMNCIYSGKYFDNSLKYWNERINGKVLYKEALKALNVRSSSLVYRYPKKVLLLHVFRDSPFFALDQKRVFNDYFDWCIFTLKYIYESGENWAIRLHPSAKDWGEDQKDVLSSILRKLGFKISDNMLIDDGLVSNDFIFKNCELIVTYQGSAAIEALAYGKKVISISGYREVISQEPFLFIIPNSVNEYLELISSSSFTIFNATSYEQEIGIKLLYAKEVLLSLSKYTSITGALRGQLNSISEEIEKGLELRCSDMTNDFIAFIKENFEKETSSIFPVFLANDE